MILLLAGLAFGWIAVSGMKELSSIIGPIFLALNLIVVAYPIKTALVRRGMPQWVGALLATLAVFVALILFFWSIVWAVTSLVNELPHYGSKFDQLQRDGLKYLERFGVDQSTIDEQLRSIDSGKIMGWVTQAASVLSGVFSLLAVVVTMLFFLAMDSMGFSRRMEIAGKHHSGLVRAFNAFSHGVRKYWIVSTVFGLIVAVLDYGVLLALGVPLALVWGVLAFVTNYIPNIGFVFGLIPPALMALLDKGVAQALIVVVAYCVLNFVVQSIIQPKVAGDAVGVTASLSFFSLLFWSWALGPLGSILALPATLLVKSLLVDGDPESRWANAFIAADPTTAEAETVESAAGLEDEADDPATA